MKKFITLFLVFVCLLSQAQTMRNLVLGTYSGIYWRYGGQPEIIEAGVKIIPHPTNPDGCVLIDTLNSITDTVFVSSGIANSDTFLTNTHEPCGDFFPANDSIIYIYFPLEDNGQPDGQFHITKVKTEEPLGLDESEKVNLRLFPNPVSDRLFITGASFTTYAVYSAQGQVLMEGALDITDKPSLNINHLQAGLYYIKLAGFGKNVIRSFIKQ